MFCLREYFTCRLYQTDFTGSALVTDNRSFILFSTSFNLTPTSSSQQSEVTTAVLCSYNTITRHLPPFGATANIELLSLTHLTFSWGVLLTFEKMIPKKTFSSQLCSDRTQNRTKVKCFVVHPVIKLHMVPYKMSVGHASVARETLSVIYDSAVRKSN